MIRRVLNEERGNALTVFAVTAPIFFLFLALALDVGNWYTHKRQLQNRADAAALAGGVDYGDRLTACLGTDPAAKTAAAGAITQVTKQYAGDPNAAVPAPKYNVFITNQGTLNVAVNASDYGAADNSDGGDPCTRRTAGDWISAPPVQWTDVKVKETNIPTLFGTFGVPVPAITARARVELRPAESDNLFVPLGIPDPVIVKAQARFFNACISEGQPGYYLAVNGQTKVDLVQLADQSQAPQYTTLWGPSGGSAVSLTLASGATCQGGSTNGWIPIGVEIRLAGLNNVDIDGPTCTALHSTAVNTAIKYADCYSDPAMIRVWKDDATPDTGDPAFKNVKLFNGSPLCKYDPHFTRAGCSFGGSVDVGWGTRPGSLSDTSHVTYSIKLNGVTLTPVSGKNGIWSVGGGINPAAVSCTGTSCVQNVTLTWSWSDTNTSDSWNTQPCTNPPPGPPNKCKEGPTDVVVQRSFTGTDDNSGIVQLLQLTTAGVGTGATLFDSANVSPTPVSLNLNVALQAAFKPDTSTTSPLTTLRQSGSQGNQSLNCNTKNQGDDFDEYAKGCQLFYSTNTYALADGAPNPVTNSPWWQGTPHQCPGGTDLWAMLSSNSASQPWLCVATAPGAPNNTIACAMAYRTGNWKGGTPNSNCGPNDVDCKNPNRYAEYVAGSDKAGDPRVVKVFVVPFGAFKGITGNGSPPDDSPSVPLYDFAAFYVTGWSGNGKKDDPCLDPAKLPAGAVLDDEPANLGEIVGHFVKWEGPNIGPVDPNQECTLDQLRPCRAVLVR